MGMILKDSEWEKLQTVQKGNIGEGIVQAFLEKMGFVVYRAVTDGAHPFDMLAIKDKKLAIAAEVKTKAMRTYYEDTGFNKSTWEDYMAFSEKHKMDIYIFFVDEHKMEIYGNWLRILEKPRVVNSKNGKRIEYPMDSKSKYGKELRYYPYCAMNHIAWLDETTANKLKDLSQRSYDYCK